MRICEIFYSLQGEGMLMGLPTVFVRTVGCNLDCSWCDTPYARDGGKEMLVEDIAKKVEAFGVDTVCITGGEPLIQDETYQLIDALLDKGFYIQLETNGSISLERLPSSGMKGNTIMKNLEMLSPFDQLKFVVAGKEDMDFVEDILSNHEIKCPVIVTAVGGVKLLEVSEWVLSKRLQVRVMPQLQKIIWGEQRGV
jgi:7-carboxy-7-deazaguanine synthase